MNLDKLNLEETLNYKSFVLSNFRAREISELSDDFSMKTEEIIINFHNLIKFKHRYY